MYFNLWAGGDTLTKAIYPGSFDPITIGHLDIVERAAALFDELIVAVYAIPDKRLHFSTDERHNLVEASISHLNNVRAERYTNLTVQFARQMGAKVIVRGLRAGQDFEREFEMALMNKRQAPDIESIFLMASAKHQFLSSSLIKEVAHLDGDIDDLLPPPVAKALKEHVIRQRT
jgi:pantetheine-phosphate adenylyltransferase